MNETDKPTADATPGASTTPAADTPLLPPPEAVSPRQRRKRPSAAASDKESAKTAAGAPAAPSAADKRSTMPPSQPPRSALGLFAVLLALIALALAGYGVYQTQRLQQTKSDRQAMEEQISAAQSLIQTETDRLQQQLGGLQSADSEARQQLDELRAAYQQLNDDRHNDVLAWRIAEIDYLLSSAGQHLALSRDIDGTLRALEAADRALQRLNDPGLLPVREQLAAERTALASVEAPDLPGMVLTLTSLLQSIEQLPVRDLQRTPMVDNDNAIGQPRWQQYLARIWQELKSLVTIRRSTADVKPLLDPELEWYVRETLRLKLEQARLALLRQQGDLFDQLLSETESWLERYFDADAGRVERLRTELQSLRAAPLATALPDLGAALRSLRQWTTRHLEQRGNRPPAANNSRTSAQPSRSANP